MGGPWGLPIPTPVLLVLNDLMVSTCVYPYPQQRGRKIILSDGAEMDLSIAHKLFVAHMYVRSYIQVLIERKEYTCAKISKVASQASLILWKQNSTSCIHTT